MLVESGITTIEVMPVWEFRVGSVGGTNAYSLRRHICTARQRLRSFIDVRTQPVWASSSMSFITTSGRRLCPRPIRVRVLRKHNATEWGDGLKLRRTAVRARTRVLRVQRPYWIDEFRLDGLRLDATQDIHDRSEPPSSRRSWQGRFGRARTLDRPGGRKRATACPPGSSTADGGSDWTQCGTRLSPQGCGCRHGTARGLLLGPSRRASGDHFRRKYGYLFQVSATRGRGSGGETRRRLPCVFVCDVHRKPRSDRQLGDWYRLRFPHPGAAIGPSRR